MHNPLQLALQSFKKNSYIIVEGKHRAEYFYIIRSGTVRVSKEVEVVEEEGGNILEPGDFFGVVSTMSSHSHIETAQALTDVTLIAVHQEQYGLLIERNTPVAMKIIQSFSKRMRFLDEALTRLTFKSTAEIDLNHLFIVGEYYAKNNKYNQAYFAYHQYLKFCPDGKNVKTALDRVRRIKPYAKSVYLEDDSEVFTREYPKEAMIFSEGQPGNELYIIQKGSVKISKIVDNQEVMLAILKTGDIFGEMALIEKKARSASAEAYEDAVLLAVNQANFERMVTTQPQIISRLTTLLAERIWFIYKQLANAIMEKPLGRLYDALLIQLEKARVPIKSGSSYTFEFGKEDLINMIGVPMAEGRAVMIDLMKNKNLREVDNKIFISDIEEIEKQAKYFRKMEKITRSRKASF
ncbi:Crp/Fnr family transcriptional regulator [Spirochaeta cellobiosiphila]|uniref:Crp/Fnr family transcriptional regulator n=1 Tax=Spirochaeta cellobiosiphila TaxID=504483 RepID=UPI000406B674|nr:Crp/Fnr family transcriptional regulator [Spirochaeta cellobiosiphila]